MINLCVNTASDRELFSPCKWYIPHLCMITSVKEVFHPLVSRVGSGCGSRHGCCGGARHTFHLIHSLSEVSALLEIMLRCASHF